MKEIPVGLALILLRLVVHYHGNVIAFALNHDNKLFAVEALYADGTANLVYMFLSLRTCGAISLKSQELTAVYLAVRLYCGFFMEYDTNSLLDAATLVVTLWVVYMIRFKLRSSYLEYQDDFPTYYVVVPCALLALLVHPTTGHSNRISWAFSVYLEALSALPQLWLMRNEMIEPFTTHYVIILGVARFVSRSHWVLQVLDAHGYDYMLTALGGGMCPAMVLLAEILRLSILVGFYYYDVKTAINLRNDGLPRYNGNGDYTRDYTL